MIEFKLRYILRNGQLILQEYVEETPEEGNPNSFWRDVPIVKNELDSQNYEE